ncbi:MAG: molybdopterin-dependent oxidoreductase, partial [Dehalococcoidia bacterium]|nr:molybdopterin-dependent oxidoreductase [Dehalococcoidia bacterium]
MARPKVKAGGGLPAMWYVAKKSREAGGPLKLYSRLRSKNTCKTCALGMGGQHGGMVNEAGHFPEVCKKSVQAQAADMAGFIPELFFRNTPIEELASYSSRELEHLGRLAYPLLAEPGDTHFRRITWDDALDRIARNFGAASPGETFFYSSGRSSNEAAFLLQLVARAFGTANIHNCSFYCHQASGVALNGVYGSTTGSITLEDIGETDLVLLAGANPASNHPRLITQLVNLRRRGGRVIVVNPLREVGLERFRVPSDWRSMLFGSDIASTYIQPHVGSDAVFFLGVLKALAERGATDEAFIREYTEGWNEVAANVESTSWDDITETCGVSRPQIESVAEELAGAERGIFLWAMGLTHHAHGVENIEALSNIALARGWLGRPGSGLMPIRGHSNVQGVGSVGVTPQLKQAFASRLEELYGITVPAEPGQHTYASMEAAAEGRIRAALLLGGNLFGSNPDREWAASALRAIPFTVSISTKLNEGHIHGRGQESIILPALARDEEHQATTQESMFNYVRLSEGGDAAVPGQMRSEVDIIASIAERILPEGRFDWGALRSHEALRHSMAE